jgi:hypothetical protein
VRLEPVSADGPLSKFLTVSHGLSLHSTCVRGGAAYNPAHSGLLGGVPVTTPLQVDLDQAAHELEIAYREYERANQDLSSLPTIATQERAALVQHKVEAWNALEAARVRYEDAQKRAAQGET